MPEPDDYEARAFEAEACLEEITDWIITQEPDRTCCDFCAGYAAALADIDSIVEGTPCRLGPHYTHVQTIQIAPAFKEAL